MTNLSDHGHERDHSAGRRGRQTSRSGAAAPRYCAWMDAGASRARSERVGCDRANPPRVAPGFMGSDRVPALGRKRCDDRPMNFSPHLPAPPGVGRSASRSAVSERHFVCPPRTSPARKPHRASGFFRWGTRVEPRGLKSNRFDRTSIVNSFGPENYRWSQ